METVFHTGYEIDNMNIVEKTLFLSFFISFSLSFSNNAGYSSALVARREDAPSDLEYLLSGLRCNSVDQERARKLHHPCITYSWQETPDGTICRSTKMAAVTCSSEFGWEGHCSCCSSATAITGRWKSRRPGKTSLEVF